MEALWLKSQDLSLTLRTRQLSGLFESWSPEFIPCHRRWSPEFIPCHDQGRNKFRTPTSGRFDTLRKVS